MRDSEEKNAASTDRKAVVRKRAASFDSINVFGAHRGF